jgi:hypothetical protein
MSSTRRTGILLVVATLALLLVGLISRNDAPSQAREAPSPVRQAPSQGAAPDENVMNCRLRQFADGVTRVSPVFRADVKATNDDWAELTRLLHAFAESHEWLFKDYSLTKPGVVKTLELSLCAPNQPSIEVAEQRWASQGWAPLSGRGVTLYFYGAADAAWHPVAIEIVEMLEKRWQVGFIDDGGYEIDRPQFLGEHASPVQP